VQQTKSIRSIKGGLWQTIVKAIRAVVVNKAVANKEAVNKVAAKAVVNTAADKVAKKVAVAAGKATAELPISKERLMTHHTLFHFNQSNSKSKEGLTPP